MRPLFYLPVAALAAAVLLAPAPNPRLGLLWGADEKDTVQADELRLKNAFQNTDGASLVAFLRTRARGEASAEKLSELIEALDNKSAAVRQKACGDLVAIGTPAVP